MHRIDLQQPSALDGHELSRVMLGLLDDPLDGSAKYLGIYLCCSSPAAQEVGVTLASSASSVQCLPRLHTIRKQNRGLEDWSSPSLSADRMPNAHLSVRTLNTDGLSSRETITEIVPYLF